MRRFGYFGLIAGLLFTFARCGMAVTDERAAPPALPVEQHAASARSGAALLSPADTAKVPATCPATQPPAPPFTPPAPYLPTSPHANSVWYGTTDLWTTIPTDGTWGQLARGEKVFWWREGFDYTTETRPDLKVTARRLDAPAPPFQASPATNGFHDDFQSFMLTGVDLPAPGCWKITGSYHGHELSFITWVTP